MSDGNNCHPLRHEGASRISRLVQSLRPDAFRLDERGMQDLIVAAHRYAQTLRFFDQTDSQPAGAYWEGFWEVEILTYLAVVAATDTDEIRRKFEAANAELEAAQQEKPAPGKPKKTPATPKEDYRPLLEHLRLLALSLEETYQKLVRIKHPLQTLLLNRIRRDNCCDPEETESALHRLIQYHKYAEGNLLAKYSGFFAPDRRWGLKDRVEFDALSAKKEFNQNDLRELFNTFFNTWLVLKNAAQTSFDAELARMELPEDVEYRVVQPHVALFLTFLRLFRHAQDSLNELGTRHLDFYYEQVLGLHPLPESPDDVFLVFELAKDFDQHLLEKGTGFLAGKDKNGRPLLFETVEDWVLRPAQVADIRNTWIDPACGGIHANPDVKKAYENGAEKPNENADYWRSMGDDRHLPDGQLGFAIASPQLILREGKRVIDITLNLLNQLDDPDSLRADYFDIFLSSEEDWVNPVFDATVDPDSSLPPDLKRGSFNIHFDSKAIRIRIVLERDDLPVDTLGEALAVKAGFDTRWPIVKVIVRPDLEKPCPTDTDITLTTAAVYEMLRTLVAGEIEIRVAAYGIRENLIIQSDQGIFDGTQKVFPFSPVPEVGNRFYIGSTEVFQKALDSLQVKFEWIAPPDSFQTHYKEYTAIDPVLYPTPNPKVLIEFVDRADGKRILIEQVIRNGALTDATKPIRIKITDVNFDPVDNVDISTLDNTHTLTVTALGDGLYDVGLPAGFDIKTQNFTYLFSKNTEDFEVLDFITFKNGNGIAASNLEIVLFPREKLFDVYPNTLRGNVRNFYREPLPGIQLNNDPDILTDGSGNFSIAASASIPQKIEFKDNSPFYENFETNTDEFSVFDALLYPVEKTEFVGDDSFSDALEGNVKNLKKNPQNLKGINVVARQNNLFIAATKTDQNGHYELPGIGTANTVDFYFDRDPVPYLSKSLAASAAPKNTVNAFLLSPRVALAPPSGPADIAVTVRDINNQPLSDVNLQIGSQPSITIPNGSHSILDVDPGATLVFSKNSFITVRTVTNHETRLDIIMPPDIDPVPTIEPGQAADGTAKIAFANTLDNSFLSAFVVFNMSTSNPITTVATGINELVITTFNVAPAGIPLELRHPNFKTISIPNVTTKDKVIIPYLIPTLFSESPLTDPAATDHEIVGKVINLSNDPVQAVEVVAMQDDWYFRANTDTNGNFRIMLPSSSPTSGWKIFASAGGRVTESSNIDKKKYLGILLGPIHKSRPFTGSINGTVVGPDDQPIAGVRISDPTNNSSTVSEKNGYFELNDIGILANLSFQHPLYETYTINISDNSIPKVILFPLKNKAYRVLEGVVTDIFKVALKNVSIQLQVGPDDPAQANIFELAVSKTDGSYRVVLPDGLIAGSKLIFSLKGFKVLAISLPLAIDPPQISNQTLTKSLMNVRLSYDEINYTPLIEADEIQDFFDVKINSLNLIRDIRTQEFDKYSPTLKRGFIRLTLEEDDFMHLEYPKMLTWYALDAAGEINLTLYNPDGTPIQQTTTNSPPPPPIPNPPYTPATNNISLDYSSTQIITGADNEKIDQFFHLLPFNGHKWIPLEAVKPQTEPAVQLLYPYMPDDTLPVTVKQDNNGQEQIVVMPYAPGNLYIGISDLTPGGTLSLLFQIAGGTETDPEALAPAIHWSYLAAGNNWLPFKTGDIIRDTTAGLTRSGMIQFAVPTTAVRENTLFQPANYWLRAAARQADKQKKEADTYVQALPSMTDIRAQVVQARFKNQDNDLAHLAQPLPPETVVKLVESRTAVKKIEQPLESFGGSLPEKAGLDFYYRVAERLRHKDRAVTVWDYEHLLLQRFPRTAAAKCIQHTRYKSPGKASQLAPGYVTVAVIPDLKRRPGSPWPEPRFPQGDLDEMRAFLSTRTNLFVAHGEKDEAYLQVVNPLYEKVDVLVTVAFMPGDEAFYKQQLEKELTHYISPWLADPAQPPRFGRTLLRSAILQFIEERPYVDYVDMTKPAPPAGNGDEPEDPLAGSKFLVRMQVVDVAGRPRVFKSEMEFPEGSDQTANITTVKTRLIVEKICPSTARSILVAGKIVIGSILDTQEAVLPPPPSNFTVTAATASVVSNGTGQPASTVVTTVDVVQTAIIGSQKSVGKQPATATKKVKTAKKTNK